MTEPFATVLFVPPHGPRPPVVAVAAAVGRGVAVAVGPAATNRTELMLKSPPFTTVMRRILLLPPEIEMPEIVASTHVCHPPVAFTGIVPSRAPSSETWRSPTAAPADATRA